jgi:glucose/arabinose dehydrogenase
MAFRPGTRELWIADVGWNDWEELDRVRDVGSARPQNFGWPCYEGALPQPAYQALGLDICASLYASPAEHTEPVFTYHHDAEVVAGDGCLPGHSAVTGVAFYQGTAYPDDYRGALFFADAVRSCIWVMPAGPDGVPDPARRRPFRAGTPEPVDLQMGPGQDLYYVSRGGTVRRIVYSPAENTP